MVAVNADPALKRVGGGTGFLLFIGVILGIAAQHPPWGNGFFGSGLFLGCTVLTPVFAAVLRRKTRIAKWPRIGVATVLTMMLAAVVSYKTARPDPRSTLAYMLAGSIPESVRIEWVRREWFDGETYVAKFNAEEAEIHQLLGYRHFKQNESSIADPETMLYRSAFFNAGPLQHLMMIPILKSPQWYEYSNLDSPDKVRGEWATLLWDADTHECWLMFCWT